MESTKVLPETKKNIRSKGITHPVKNAKSLRTYNQLAKSRKAIVALHLMLDFFKQLGVIEYKGFPARAYAYL